MPFDCSVVLLTFAFSPPPHQLILLVCLSLLFSSVPALPIPVHPIQFGGVARAMSSYDSLSCRLPLVCCLHICVLHPCVLQSLSTVGYHFYPLVRPEVARKNRRRQLLLNRHRLLAASGYVLASFSLYVAMYLCLRAAYS